MRNLLWPVLLLLLAVVLRSEFFFYLLYAVGGLLLLGSLWLRLGMRQLRWRRVAPSAAFPGEQVQIAIELENRGLLPLPWLSLHESLPPALHTPPMIREVLSLDPGERRTIGYSVSSARRGYYTIGPLAIQTGDVLGLGERGMTAPQVDAITIYPRVVPLDELFLPAALPFGTIVAPRSLFSDPSRPAGTRPYQPSDGVRRVDWKNSARTGELLIRRQQPAIAMDTLIALAFALPEYDAQFRYDTMERALIAAASIAAHLHAFGQPVGLVASGHDQGAEVPAGDESAGAAVAIGTGRAHLTLLLGVLGRLAPASQSGLMPLLRTASARLGWGGTLVVIGGQAATTLLPELLALRRRGLQVALVLAAPTPEDLALARRHGVTALALRDVV